MNWLLSTFTLLIGFNAFALGPIPNGTYKGTEICNGTSYPIQMVFTDTTLSWAGQLDSFEFDSNSNGFFKLKPISGLTGNGLGHFTENGLHYEVVYDYPADDGSTHPSPGEITLTYKQGTLHLDSSASAGSQGKLGCTGDFSKAP